LSLIRLRRWRDNVVVVVYVQVQLVALDHAILHQVRGNGDGDLLPIGRNLQTLDVELRHGEVAEGIHLGDARVVVLGRYLDGWLRVLLLVGSSAFRWNIDLFIIA